MCDCASVTITNMALREFERGAILDQIQSLRIQSPTSSSLNNNLHALLVFANELPIHINLSDAVDIIDGDEV
jgi:hypothetical protein